MSKLTPEQIAACRGNPLAAYLAKRLGWMLILVGLVNLGCLISIIMAFTYTVAPAQFDDHGAVHVVALLTTGVVMASGVGLAYELNWMRRYQISPECFEPAEPAEPTGPSELHWRNPPPLYPEVDQREEMDWRAMVKDLREFAARHGKSHREARTKMEKEYLRSLEVQANALADIVETGCRTLEDKQEFGHHGSNTGFRQLEMSHSAMQRIVRISQAASRTLYSRHKKPLAKS